jgi:5S rRNA maturation endonuclease (ribonuclease M5)
VNEFGVTSLLRSLGVAASEIVEDTTRGWVNCPCPLAVWTHGGGEDQRPSFGISIDEDRPSVFYCFGCMHEVQGLGRLLGRIFVLSGAYPWETASIYALHEVQEGHRRLKTPPLWDGSPIEDGLPDPLPPAVLGKFPILQGDQAPEAVKVRDWIEKIRKIPVWAQNLFRLRYDAQRRSVVFPLTDLDGRIYVLRERRRQTKKIWTVTPKIAGTPGLEFPRLRDTGVWFGMHLANWSDPVMLVEGEFDAMRVASLGFMNVIASATSSVADKQIDALDGDSYILGYDADKGGEHAVRRIKDRIGGNTSLRLARWEVVGCKDGGDLQYEEQLHEVLNSLEEIA